MKGGDRKRSKPDSAWRALFRRQGWPEPPPGTVEDATYRMGTRDLWALVDGVWYWSRDARGKWMPSVYGPM